MSEHPSPAPDPTPSPWAAAEGPPATGGPDGAGGPPLGPHGGPPLGPPGGGPGWGAGWGPPPPPPPAGPSPGRVLAIVLGAVTVAGVATVGLLIGAVTFLGTSSEPQFTEVGSSIQDDGGFTIVGEEPYDDEPYEDPYADPYEDPNGDPYEEPYDPYGGPTAAVLAEVSAQLEADSWSQVGEQLLPAEAPVASAACAPTGWQTGALDRAIGMFDDPGLPSHGGEHVTVVLVAYETDEDAAADLERARSPEYQACEVEQRADRRRLDGDAAITVLPEDPAAPGVAIAMTESGGEQRTELDVILVVGRMRAQLEVCHCAGFDEEYLGWVAADVAAAMAVEQGLPIPG